MVLKRKRQVDFRQALEDPINHGEFPAGLGVNLPGERLVDGVADGRAVRLEWLRGQIQEKIQDIAQHETALRVTGAGIGLLIGVGVSVFTYNQIKHRRQQGKAGSGGGAADPSAGQGGQQSAGKETP